MKMFSSSKSVGDATALRLSFTNIRRALRGNNSVGPATRNTSLQKFFAGVIAAGALLTLGEIGRAHV